MSNYILQIKKICKIYHGFSALNNVSISLEKGKIYGLIGQNGAGKSTLMRIISGLSFPTSGNISLFGDSDNKKLAQHRRYIGCLIENPSIIGNMTAAENLIVHKKLKGITTKNIEKETLQLVGLNNTGKKKAKDFSLGMRQRLGIAITLLGNPNLLILDEPINGLDPSGVVEIRNLLIELCKKKSITILISSHNLAELYQTASEYIIINNGKVLKRISLVELAEQCGHYLLIGCSEPIKLEYVLKNIVKTTNYSVLPDNRIKLFDYLNEKEKLSKILIKNGIIVTTFASQEDTLENYYLSLIAGESHD